MNIVETIISENFNIIDVDIKFSLDNEDYENIRNIEKETFNFINGNIYTIFYNNITNNTSFYVGYIINNIIKELINYPRRFTIIFEKKEDILHLYINLPKDGN